MPGLFTIFYSRNKIFRERQGRINFNRASSRRACVSSFFQPNARKKEAAEEYVYLKVVELLAPSLQTKNDVRD